MFILLCITGHITITHQVILSYPVRLDKYKLYISGIKSYLSFQNIIIFVPILHVHLDHNHCLETIAVKGKAKELTRLADKLIGMRGIKHGELLMTETG